MAKQKIFDWLKSTNLLIRVLRSTPKILSKMSLKCSFCSRTFSRRTAYTLHINKCILSAESSNDSSDYDEINYNLLKDKLNTFDTSKFTKINNLNKITPEYIEYNASYSNTFIDVCISYYYYIMF